MSECSTFGSKGFGQEDSERGENATEIEIHSRFSHVADFESVTVLFLRSGLIHLLTLLAMTRGAFVVIEGLDRSGKSTQAARLLERLEATSKPVQLLKFPGNR